MTGSVPESLMRLAGELEKLPGIGPRSAERIAFFLLKAERDEALRLADAIRDMKEHVRHCSQCFNLTESDPCPICADPRRDASQIVVVEQPKDLLQLEATGVIRGVYHVLLGHIAPLDGIEPADLTIDALVERVRRGGVREIVLGTNPTMEGEGTALHIKSVLSFAADLKISRLARGLPSGSQIEYANKAILRDAIEGRTAF